MKSLLAMLIVAYGVCAADAHGLGQSFCGGVQQVVVQQSVGHYGVQQVVVQRQQVQRRRVQRVVVQQPVVVQQVVRRPRVVVAPFFFGVF